MTADHGCNTTFTTRTVCFFAVVVCSGLLAWRSLFAVLSGALHYDQYTHILLVLPVSLVLLYLDRRQVFRQVGYSLAGGIALAAVAGLALLAWRSGLLQGGLSLSILLLVCGWTSAFVLCYGVSASRAAVFPLLFLLLMVPIPDFVLDRVTWWLQTGSADVTYLLLRTARVPVLRNGVLLSLPGIDIEVAKECSGIRSTLMLLIVSLVLAQLFLRTGARKLLFTLAIFPVTVIKNGLRIFVLSTLSLYVDPSFLSGRLHHYGGIPFFGLALGSLLLLLWAFRRSESRVMLKICTGVT